QPCPYAHAGLSAGSAASHSHRERKGTGKGITLPSAFYDFRPGIQNKYFTANCMILGSRAVLIWPKMLLLRLLVGLFRRTLFVILNASARTSSRRLSPRLNVRESAVSHVQ